MWRAYFTVVQAQLRRIILDPWHQVFMYGRAAIYLIKAGSELWIIKAYLYSAACILNEHCIPSLINANHLKWVDDCDWDAL